ncbi:MAG: PorT family protein [Cyclobacteriaceae bacterium]|nr:PorT family protein [Cyclobacteriaceae bacterium]
MRKITLVVLFVMLTTAAAWAQASVSLGVKGGLNFANINTSTLGTAYNSRTGYHAGAFVNIKLTKLAIQPELIYSVQGSDISTATSSQSIDLAYVNIPILLKFYLVGGLNLQAGPQFGFLASATQGGTDIKSLVKGSDTSVALGAGFDISKFVIDARYNLGLSEINDAAGSSAAKNQVFQLSVGFKLFKFGN